MTDSRDVRSLGCEAIVALNLLSHDRILRPYTKEAWRYLESTTSSSKNRNTPHVLSVSLPLLHRVETDLQNFALQNSCSHLPLLFDWRGTESGRIVCPTPDNWPQMFSIFFGFQLHFPMHRMRVVSKVKCVCKDCSQLVGVDTELSGGVCA